MNEQGIKKPKIEKIGSSILVSESSRNGIVLIIAILFAAIMGGVLGAFKNGEFQKTYDFVQVEMALE